ncbi:MULTISPECIES: ribosomal protein S18-alanine N-acetyltransferase [Uliginosibacterium]|uniref:[Ribosomal protein bS18]-alanine N-acetyltransferase n=1 Tax=Uliginosibacterium aquaticum TaxID=2731212 RepID=A0ABX2IJ13_9RHOO|nr:MULTISPECIES: ribosomal protein S18-alanine N-acetyltransferase [Uliginosibacterium]MDO6385481.1 ribosomal protein S18-alanine N-acetyltransferase [Uliginosibacterium sp. 31-12]NSL56821.1 ribosomal protein S18-alanine N-acetyltransferase [Uliginosibacterium aquaticum]
MRPDPHLQFLPMQEADLVEVADCEVEATEHPWSLQNFRDALHAGNSCWVMRSGGVLLAQGVMMRVLDEAHLLIISVSPAWQGMGLGRQLLDHLCLCAAEQGAREMFLEVRPSNLHALALYGKRGFAEIGRRKAYYPAQNGQREDALVMRLEL